MARKPLRIVIAGGGTGGHLFPIVAIADALVKRSPETVIHLVGSKFGMESTLFQKRREPLTLLGIRGYVRGLSVKAFGRNLAFPFRFVGAYIKARSLLSTFDPHVVVGTGGYASGLPLLAAGRMGIPILIHEQNSYPGFTTRWLSARARVVCLSYAESEQYLKKKIPFSPETRSVKTS